MDRQKLSINQFGRNADGYLTSAVHATGADLDRLAAMTARIGCRRTLDVGCGAGHASFAMARGGAQSVTAFDPSREMLAVVAREAMARGHSSIATVRGPAETLPFAPGSFDLVASRFSAHHWTDVPRALSECARVLAPGGSLVVIDVVAPEDPVLDTPLQVMEFLRDGSHVRNYSGSEWACMLVAAGFAAPGVTRWRLPLTFDSWVARIGTSKPRIDALRTVLAELSTEARAYLELSDSLAFTIEAAWMDTRAAAPGV